jgi:hypothetical protein
VKPSFSDLTSSAAVQAALNEFVKLGRKAFLARYGFGSARAYVVRDPITGIEADSKAVVGAAIGFQFPEHGPLTPPDFSGGDATVAPLLQALGFSVRHLDSERSGDDWSVPEVELIVADYLAMLTLELTGQRYNKTAHRQALLQRLPNRSAGSVEFKHANISAVMLEMGFPYLRGYKPRVNFQRRLMTQVVTKHVLHHRVLDDAAMAASERPAEPLQAVDFARVRAEAPGRNPVAREPSPAYETRAVKRDYLEREARNRSLGRAGECFALDFERWRLLQMGVGQLAERVEHVSETQGDGLGFDIQSFETDGRDRFIEVKTTAFGERTPFFVSANEVLFARSQTERFHLYRVFDFRASPRMFDLVGPIEQSCALDPTTFRASFG